MNNNTKINPYIKFTLLFWIFCFLLNVFIAGENATAKDTKNTVTKNFVIKDGTIQTNVPKIDLRTGDEKKLDKAIAKTRIYPPYPDIWGYDIADDTKSSIRGPNLSTMISLEGDIVFESSVGNNTAMMFYFFGSKKVNRKWGDLT